MKNTNSNNQEASAALKPEDTMAEAGRQILLREYLRMLAQDEGVRADDDLEYVHDMRVATRRQRSAFRLLEDYYKSKPVRPYIQSLKLLADALGSVRDLDVMMDNLKKAKAGRPETDRPAFDAMVVTLDKKRRKVFRKLIALLDSKVYRNFLDDYAAFLTQTGSGAKSIDADSVSPSQVRHILPSLLHEHLAAVRAYDNVIDEDIEATEDTTLHALRIEFKRLRYATHFFSDVLGASGDEFIKEIKVIQDHLGRMNDIYVAQAQIESYLENLNGETDEERLAASDALHSYLEELQTEHAALKTGFPAVWRHFNSRAVQRKLSDALLVLR